MDELDDQDLLEHFGVKKPEDLAQSPIDDELKHFGVKGMKWGVRKKGPQTQSGDAKKTASIKKKRREKGPSSLTNKELKTAIERIRLEKQYKEMDPHIIKKGAKAAAAALVVAQTVQSAYSLAKKAGVFDQIGKLLAR